MNSLVPLSLIGSGIIFWRVENFEITAFPRLLIDEFNCKKRFHTGPLVVELYAHVGVPHRPIPYPASNSS